MKYIMIEGSNGIPTPIIFPQILEHMQVSLAVSHLGKTVSAGFCNIYGDDADVWGGSVSLGIKSKSEDAAIIKRHL